MPAKATREGRPTGVRLSSFGGPYDGANAEYRATGGMWHGRFLDYV